LAAKTGMNILDTRLYKYLVYPDILEKGSEHLHSFYKSEGLFYTFDLCIGECANIFKRKWLKEKVINKNGSAFFIRYAEIK
jgi:hypothetical protein